MKLHNPGTLGEVALVFAVAGAALGVSGPARADSLTLRASAYAFDVEVGSPPLDEQDERVITTSDPSASASASASVGRGSASAVITGLIVRDDPGREGQVILSMNAQATSYDDLFSPYGGYSGGFARVGVSAPSAGAGTVRFVWSSQTADVALVAGQIATEESGDLSYFTSDLAGFTFDFTGYTAGGFRGPSDVSSIAALVWGLDGLPGSTPDDPLMPYAAQFVTEQPTLMDDENEIADIPAMVHGSFFTAPVTQNYGIDEFIYFDPEFAAGYLYTVEGSTFSHFLLPDALPGGDSSFQLYFGGTLYDYTAGSEFDFTAFAPGGVSRFLLLGIDSSEMIDVGAAHAPFVSGLKFTTGGVAQVWQVPLVASAVPEPSALVLLTLGGLAPLGMALRRHASRRDAA